MGSKSSRGSVALVSVAMAAAVFVACSKESKPAAEAPAQATAETGSAAAKPAAAKFTEANFTLEMRPVGSYAAGEEGHVEVVLDAKGAFKCNDKYPYKLKLESTQGVKFPSAVVKKDSLTLAGKRAVMKVPFVPETAGQKRIAGRFSFSVCTEERCLIERRDLALAVDVQ